MCCRPSHREGKHHRNSPVLLLLVAQCSVHSLRGILMGEGENKDGVPCGIAEGNTRTQNGLRLGCEYQQLIGGAIQHNKTRLGGGEQPISNMLHVAQHDTVMIFLILRPHHKLIQDKQTRQSLLFCKDHARMRENKQTSMTGR